MGEESNIYYLDDFSFDVLECYIKHGFGNAKIYQTNFFTIDSDEMACMTLTQYYEKVLGARNTEKKGNKCNKEYCAGCGFFDYTSSVLNPNKLHIRCNKTNRFGIVDLEHSIKPEDFNEEADN